ncbi:MULTISPECIES: hypothetical protein [Paraburkholderia]|jgi:hypothetical protein|uniref:hypothetical protein n=1 Tax=Paraburkholderia TaxID=1822464 RepID=UPI00117EE943|nr:hypothetical protein [Paraburkholderia phenazinium]
MEPVPSCHDSAVNNPFQRAVRAEAAEAHGAAGFGLIGQWEKGILLMHRTHVYSLGFTRIILNSVTMAREIDTTDAL